ncbi:MAG TPA: TetR family transcriptional regulator [Acidimicrobiales bacterium]|nr:TetR family transcriptional regulator [Acidimicrobiales bacterium]
MSRARVRPTRDETRRRLFRAAAEVFAHHGVGAATVEQIAAAAGFTRGAFYSNFAGKQELAVAMLDDHLARSQAHNRALLARHPDPAGFVQALRDDVGREDDPLHTTPLLQVELMLYVARTPELRPVLGAHLRAMRSLVGEIAATTVRASGVDLPVGPAELGTILVAVEDGLRLHRLIDPDSTAPDAFLDALEALERIVLAARRG